MCLSLPQNASHTIDFLFLHFLLVESSVKSGVNIDEQGRECVSIDKWVIKGCVDGSKDGSNNESKRSTI